MDAEADTTTRQELADAFDDFMAGFEQFKTTNDARLDALEAGGSVDVLLEEKLARLDATLDAQKKRIDTLSVKVARPSLGGEPAAYESPALTHKAAFEAYARKGDLAKMTALELKALSVGSEADGGYLVPDETEHEIMSALKASSPMRAISDSLTISTDTFKRPFAVTGAAGGWVGESDGRPQTATPALTELAYPTMELYAMPAATLRLLDDAAVDIDAWLAREVRDTFAAQEGAAFVTGDGINQPRGFLSYASVDNASRTWGNIGTISSGADGAFKATAPADPLIDLVYALKSAYRAKGRFVMNRLTQSALRKLKDGQGNYIWQPSLGAGLEARLLGFPVTECDDMPDLSLGSLSLAFGDFSRGYLVVDRKGVRVLRDPFTAKPYVLFYSTKRVGGGIQDFNAIKAMRFSVA